MSDLVLRLRADLTTAMKARDTATVKVLRSALSALANAEAPPVPDAGPTGPTMSGGIAGAADGLGATEADRRVLTDAEVQAILRAERAEWGPDGAALDTYV